MLSHNIVAAGRLAISWLGGMPTKQINEQYRVDARHFEAAPLKRYLDTLSDDERRSQQVKVLCLRLLPGSRSYECKVVGTRDTVNCPARS
jgi:hypothetical protein